MTRGCAHRRLSLCERAFFRGAKDDIDVFRNLAGKPVLLIATHPAAMPSKKKTALPCGDNLMLCFPSLQMVDDAICWAVEPAATLPINTSNNLAKLN